MNQKPASNSRRFPTGMTQPALRALESAGYMRLEDVAGVSRKTLLALHGFGLKSIPLPEAGLRERRLEPLKP